MNRDTGSLTPTGVYSLGTSPSHLAVNAAGTRLYSANETDRVGKDKHGTVSAFVAIIYAQLGRIVEAREMLDEAVAQRADRFVSPGWIAAAYAVLGDADEAIRWLEIADREFDSMIFNLNYPELDGLRSDARFVDLLNKLGLPANAYR